MGEPPAKVDAVPGAAPGLSSVAPDWGAIFRRNPELSPPGYEACVAAVTAATAEKRALQKAEDEAKRLRPPPKGKKPARRRR